MTKKPCPGCGLVKSCRPADAVCQDCANKFRRFEEMEAALKAATEKPDSEMKIYKFPRFFHFLPYLQHCKPRSTRECESDFMEIFYRLAESVSIKHLVEDIDSYSTAIGCASDYDLLINYKGEHCHGDVVIMKAATAEALRSFWLSMEKHFKHVYADGVADGSDLLRKMLDGKVTAEDINKHQVKVRG